MEDKFTLENLQKAIKNHKLKYVIDDMYTAISQGHHFIDVVVDFYRKKPNFKSTGYGELETLILNSLNLWKSDYLDTFDSRFKHNWVRVDSRFIIPAFISKTDFEDRNTKLRIMAVNIAYAASSKFKSENDFEEYQSYVKRNPKNIYFHLDRMVAMSLLIVYRSKKDRHQSFKELLEFYLQGELSKKWLELYVVPEFHRIEKNIESHFEKALNNWAERDSELYSYYPIAVHYSGRCNPYKVSEFLIRAVNEEREAEFQEAISTVVATKPHINAEIKILKLKYFSLNSSFDENWLHRTHRENSTILSSNEDFEKIVEWSRRKAAADFIFILEDRLTTDGSLRETDLYLPEFANLAYFLSGIDLFKSPKDALHHLSCHFKGVDKNENIIPLRWNTLRKLKDAEVIDELKKAFSKIRK